MSGIRKSFFLESFVGMNISVHVVLGVEKLPVTPCDLGPHMCIRCFKTMMLPFTPKILLPKGLNKTRIAIRFAEVPHMTIAPAKFRS